MRKFFTFFTIALIALSLSACKKETSATGYGLVYNHYVGVIDMTVDAKGVVSDIKIDEYYLAYNAAQVVEPISPRDDVVQVGTSFFAKYYNVDGKIFASSGERTWIHPTHGDLEDWVKVEANAKAYVEAVKANKVFISKADGTKITDLTITGNAKEFMTKSESGYGGTIWNWQGAINGVEEILKGTKMDSTYSLNDDKQWVVDGVVTSATLVDFANYFAIAKRAYDSATK